MFYQKRIRKKKELTSLVEIIPFLNQEKLEENKTKKEVHNNKIRNKEKNKTLSKPTGKLNTNNLSISEAKSQFQNSQIKLDKDNMPKTSFTQEQLNETWKKFAYKIRKEGKENLFSIFIGKNPTIVNENQIDFKVQSLLLLESLFRIKSQLVDYIRENLNNWSIEFTFDIENIKDEQKENLYSSKSKFNKLSKDNPALTKMKKMFNLDLDM